MKIASWNVNSIRSRVEHVKAWLDTNQPDYLLLQELKCEDPAFPHDAFPGYHAIIKGQKAYNGVAVLARDQQPSIIASTIGDDQARFLEVETPQGWRIINIYAPNGNPLGSDKFTYKLEWLCRLATRAQALLDANTPFLIAGDFNIIPDPVDAATPEAWKQDALYQPEARAAYRMLKNMGLYDALRMFHGDEGLYTFWDYQAGAWQRDNGIRIDHILLSPQLADRCSGCAIDREPRGAQSPSDHTPIYVELRA